MRLSYCACGEIAAAISIGKSRLGCQPQRLRPGSAFRVMQSKTVRVRHLTATTVRVPRDGVHPAALYFITLAPLRRKSAEGSVGSTSSRIVRNATAVRYGYDRNPQPYRRGQCLVRSVVVKCTADSPNGSGKLTI
jgi:hypothetical protein